MKELKNTIHAIILTLGLAGGMLFASCETKKETTLKSIPKPLSAAESKEVRKRWEASPDGIRYKEWELSPAGKKVHGSYDKIKKSIKDFSSMEAVVTSLTFKHENADASGLKWLIVRIDGEEYMMQFSPGDFLQLQSLKVKEQIIVKSRSAGLSPNHPYLIISGDYIERNKQVLFKREPGKNKSC